MERVLGIGGLFFRAADPAALSKWYHEHLGVTPVPKSYEVEPWTQEAGATVFAPFPADNDMSSFIARLIANGTVASIRRLWQRTSCLWLIPLVALITPSLANSDPFPSADALESHFFKDVRVTLQAPTGWSQNSRVDGDTRAFFVSRDALTEGGPFQSGISLNVISFPAHLPQESLNYAKSFAITYPNKFGDGAECGWKSGAPLTLFWCQADIDADDHATTALHHLIANTATGKLYIFMFETLREDWQQSWPAITTMLKSIVVDPAY